MPALKFENLTPAIEPVAKKSACKSCGTETAGLCPNCTPVLDLCFAAINLPFGAGIDRNQWNNRQLPPTKMKYVDKEEALLRDHDRTWWEDLLRNGWKTEVKS